MVEDCYAYALTSLQVNHWKVIALLGFLFYDGGSHVKTQIYVSLWSAVIFLRYIYIITFLKYISLPSAVNL